MPIKAPCLGALLALLVLSCDRSPAEVIMTDNTAPSYEGVSTLQVRNYVNRLYIDLLGREPLKAEMERDVAMLRGENLGMGVRENLVLTLQNGESGGGPDSVYRDAFFNRWYELAKARMLEGVSDEEIEGRIQIFTFDAEKDSLNEDWIGYQLAQAEMNKLGLVLEIREEWKNGQMDMSEIFGRLLNNYFYDQINMNTFNFIRASYDNLFWRLPTDAEFEAAFPVIEYNQPSIVLGQSAANKDDYIRILTTNLEFYEGMVIWAYRSLLSRDPRADEILEVLEDFVTDQDFLRIQRLVLISDEYANF